MGEGQCGTWMANKLADFDKKIADNKRFEKIFKAQRGEYTKCQVNWLQVIVEPEPGNSAPYNNNGGAASPNPNTNNNNNNNNNNNGYVDEGLDLGDFGRDSVNGGYANNNNNNSQQQDDKPADAAAPYSAADNTAAVDSTAAAVVVEVAKEADPG